MRAIEKKRRSFMTPGRWIWISVAAIVTLLVWSGLYFREIQIPRWSEKAEAREAALASGELVGVNNVYKHVWEETTWIAEGEDEEGNYLYVFLREGETIQTVGAEDVMTKSDMAEKFRLAKPEASLIRMTPGMYRNRPIWEVYYSLSANGQKRYYYDFYTFDHEGSMTETFRLPAKTGP